MPASCKFQPNLHPRSSSFTMYLYFCHYQESLIDSHNECFPTRVVKFNRKRHKISPWMTNGILKSINQRNRLYKNLKQFKPDSFIYTENNCISINIGMSSRKRLLMPKDLTIKIFLCNTNLT